MSGRLSDPVATPRRRNKPPKGRRAWGWLAAACAAGLLVAFGSAVRLVVTQGEERRAQTQQTANTLWRCNTLAGRKARADCLAGAR